MPPVTEDYGWLGLGGDFSSAPRDPAQPNRSFSLMARVTRANALLGQPTEVEGWRERTGLRSLYLILVQSSDVEQPEIRFLNEKDGTRVYTVEYDWLAPSFLDKGTGPWRLAGHLALVLAEISQQDDVPLPLPRG